MENEETFLLHNDAISEFNNRLYENIFTQENIISKKKCLTVSEDKYYGYYLEKGKEQYFALDEFMKKLPFKVTKSYETDFKGEVFHLIENVEEIEIPAEQRLTYRRLIEVLSKFDHTHKDHQILYNILLTALYSDRINVRVSTDAGFGKDSTVSIIQHLVNSTVNLYGATFAKLEYVLMNKLIVLNELGNLKKEEKIAMQEFLLATGAYFNTYTKRTRKTSTTQEQYDISKLSLLLLYNLPNYYTNKAQEYFDQMFTEAVINRFIPFVFEGTLTTEFETVIDSKQIVNDHEKDYTDIIATLNYYKQNPLTTIKYEIDNTVIKFSDKQKRYARTFNVILKYVSEFSNSQTEFDHYSKLLYNCYTNYRKLIETEKKEEIK